MRLTNMEKFLVNSPLRAYELRKIEAPEILSNLGVEEKSICLEIGCGRGISTLLINQYLNCEKIIGIDLDPDMIALAKMCLSQPPKWAQNIRTNNIELYCDDATSLTFHDCYFDAIFIFGVLHHIKKWKKVISEVYRVLKVGGIFSFEEALFPNLPSPFDKFLAYSYKFFGAASINERDLKDTLDKIGFSILSFKKRGLSLFPGCSVKAIKFI